MRMMAADNKLAADGGAIANFRPSAALLLSRWRYCHHPAHVAAAFVDLEHWDREWTEEQEPESDELSEWAQFEATVDQLALTPGASEAGHTAAAILTEYSTLQ
jgi:hypothetical protein